MVNADVPDVYRFTTLSLLTFTQPRRESWEKWKLKWKSCCNTSIHVLTFCSKRYSPDKRLCTQKHFREHSKIFSTPYREILFLAHRMAKWGTLPCEMNLFLGVLPKPIKFPVLRTFRPRTKVRREKNKNKVHECAV